MLLPYTYVESTMAGDDNCEARLKAGAIPNAQQLGTVLARWAIIKKTDSSVI